MMPKSLWTLAILSTCLVLSSATLAQDTVLAITHAVVIDGSGKPPLLDGTLLVQDERIQQVGPASEITIPKNARVLDAHGGSVIPGLADMHVHLVGGWDGQSADMLSYRRYLNALLFAGVTTVLDTGNVEPYILQLRQEVAAGRLLGPRIYCVGALIDGADPIWPPLSEAVVSKAQLPRIVDERKRDKVDLVKGYGGLSVPIVEELSKEAKKAGLRVIVDQWERNGSNDLMQAGIAGFAHLPTFPLSDEGAALARKTEIFFISTLAAYESIARRRLSNLTFLRDPLISETATPWDLDSLRAEAKRPLTTDEQNLAAKFGGYLKNAQHDAKLLYEDGILLAAGTDAPYPGDFQGEGIHRELELLVEAGLTPLQAITVATSNASRLVGGQAEWGTLESGKLANMVVVDGRPDQTIHDTRKIRYVINRGAIIDRTALKFDARTDPGFRSFGSSATN